MDCPECHTTLRSLPFEDVLVQECPEGHGMWFDAGELALAQTQADENVGWLDVDLWKDQDQFRVEDGARLCPRCGVLMAAVRYGATQVTVDTCAHCRGVWLDTGEFQQILQALEEQANSMTAREYWKAVLHEAGEVFTRDKNLISEVRDFRSVVRLLEYRIMVENPKVRQALIAFSASNPLK